MIPQEIKEKIFCLYWGQNVLSNGIDLGGVVGDFDDDLFLQLTPLSDITDEDAIEVAKLMYPKDRHNISDSILWGKEIAIQIMQGQTDKDVIWFAGILQVIDWLRSHAYALPAHGYSVEQLIEEGVFKIKQA